MQTNIAPSAALVKPNLSHIKANFLPSTAISFGSKDKKELTIFIKKWKTLSLPFLILWNRKKTL